jgi:ketosteroid isomerase-like protein
MFRESFRPALAILIALTLPAALQAGGFPVQATARPPAAAPAPSPSPEDRRLLDLSREWFEAVVRRDAAAVERLETDDFMSIQQIGQGVAVTTKRGQLEAFRKNTSPPPVVERTLTGITIRRYGSVAILTAATTIKTTSGPAGASAGGRAMTTEVWVNADGSWRLAHSDLTPVPPPRR